MTNMAQRTTTGSTDGQRSFQDVHFPDGICFGCGPANSNGLQLKSFPGPAGSMVAEFTPTRAHQAAERVVCGGIVGTVLDCHAAAVASAELGIEFATGEGVVTKTYTVDLLRSTPVEALTLLARAVDVRTRSVTVDAELRHGDEVCATFRGLFVSPTRKDRAALELPQLARSWPDQRVSPQRPTATIERTSRRRTWPGVDRLHVDVSSAAADVSVRVRALVAGHLMLGGLAVW
jgi:acyl-coenzyme A thioesterase PaaI-like protein